MVDRKTCMMIDSHGLPLGSAKERPMDFDEAVLRLDEDWAKHEESRYFHCPDPAPKHTACPGGNDISFALWLMEKGQ